MTSLLHIVCLSVCLCSNLRSAGVSPSPSPMHYASGAARQRWKEAIKSIRETTKVKSLGKGLGNITILQLYVNMTVC